MTIFAELLLFKPWFFPIPSYFSYLFYFSSLQIPTNILSISGKTVFLQPLLSKIPIGIDDE